MRDTGQERWLLPEGVQDLLPGESHALEHFRRQCLDLYEQHGFELVVPPLLEFRSALLTGVGSDLELRTFRMTDPSSGQQLGLRADMTPQVARMDALRPNRRAVERYCYAGSVVATQARYLGGSRCSVQIGCELYGHSGLDADLQILKLMLLSLANRPCHKLILELGHAGILRGMVKALGLTDGQTEQVHDVLLRKARAELEAMLVSLPDGSDALLDLLTLAGPGSVLQRARQMLLPRFPSLQLVLDDLGRVIDYLVDKFPEVDLYVDLAELRGYRYHTGLFFAAYVDSSRFEVAKGGRYDDVAAAFGCTRPATGFSLDALALMQGSIRLARTIFAESTAAHECAVQIAQWRQQGYRVIEVLPGEPIGAIHAGDQMLVKEQGQWCLRSLEGELSTVDRNHG